MRVAAISLLALLCFATQGYSQNLLNQRIRKITAKKQSVYFDNGIFHNGNSKTKSLVRSLRHSFSKTKGYERVVLDFKGNKLPRLYGHVSKIDRKIYLDLFSTNLPGSIDSFGNTKFVKAVNFFPITKESLSVEILLKDSVGADIFYLESPARLVIDLKK